MGSWGGAVVAEELKEKLTEYVDKVNSQKPGFIKVVRHSKQEGLIRSRVSGWRAATAPVVALFDAHVEFNVGCGKRESKQTQGSKALRLSQLSPDELKEWTGPLPTQKAEPVLTRIKENRKRIISPSFDNIKYDNFEIEEYPLAAQGFDWELWCRYLNPPKAWWKLENSTAPIRSPALIGCFIVDRQYFQEIGLLDEGMEVYGGENVELGIRRRSVIGVEGKMALTGLSSLEVITEKRVYRTRSSIGQLPWRIQYLYMSWEMLMAIPLGTWDEGSKEGVETKGNSETSVPITNALYFVKQRRGQISMVLESPRDGPSLFPCLVQRPAGGGALHAACSAPFMTPASDAAPQRDPPDIMGNTLWTLVQRVILWASVILLEGHLVWQCGGSVEVLPCSRIAHIERAHKPYTEDLTAHVRRNALRVAEVWMDEFKSHVYMAWNIPQENLIIACHCPLSLSSPTLKKSKKECNVSLVVLFSLAVCHLEMTLDH
ncbi:hypothetical protein HPG69_005895 [Diceros bicornis minor]|uniref:Glycosyltransferase 2-like domain-containing protein n=1 Tax=Diceros bicornis minor TaxID=77932 RepID=A0A7J7ESQ7_DICBM|nr:hypothetical protein HPG69_005895 [Diceros bicornis minor]